MELIYQDRPFDMLYDATFANNIVIYNDDYVCIHIEQNATPAYYYAVGVSELGREMDEARKEEALSKKIKEEIKETAAPAFELQSVTSKPDSSVLARLLQETSVDDIVKLSRAGLI